MEFKGGKIDVVDKYPVASIVVIDNDVILITRIPVKPIGALTPTKQVDTRTARYLVIACSTEQLICTTVAY